MRPCDGVPGLDRKLDCKFGGLLEGTYVQSFLLHSALKRKYGGKT